MKAKEMFEELGYELSCNNVWNIKYEKKIMQNQFWESPITIDFRINGDNEFYKYDKQRKAYPISLKEYRAINKQIEELKLNE